MNNKLNEPAHVLTELLSDSLTEAERTAIEQKLLHDDHYYELLLAAETELIDRYTHGECSQEQTQSLDRTIGISSNLHDKAVFSKVINQWVNNQNQPVRRQPILNKITSGLASAVILLMAFYLFIQQLEIKQQQEHIMQLQQHQSMMQEQQQHLEQQLGRLELLYRSLSEKTSDQ